KYKTLEVAGTALGFGIVAPPITVSFDPNVNVAGIEQPGCTRCGDCCSGCNVGAKNSVALTYLPDAVSHGAELYTHASVRHLAKTDDGDWEVHVRRLDADGSSPPDMVLRAAMVVLGAGTLGTTEILLRSRAMGLPLSDRVGELQIELASGTGETGPRSQPRIVSIEESHFAKDSEHEERARVLQNVVV